MQFSILRCLIIFVLSISVCVGSTDCQFQHGDPSGKGGCWVWDLSKLPVKTWTLNDSFPEPYLVGPVCGFAETETCNACSHVVPSVGIQLDRNGCSGHRCLSLAKYPPTSFEIDLLDTKNPGNGLVVTYGGGEGERKLSYQFYCNTSVPADAGPQGLVVENPPMTYSLRWDTPLACGKFDESLQCLADVALPTAAQMEWMKLEIGAIGHFNMGTYQSCGIGFENMQVPPAETFAPTDVDTDTWIKALHSFGAKRAVLVVSHGCGFNTFPSNTAFPEFDFVYNYSVKHSPWKSGKGDIAAEFVASCKKYGIRPGFYHGAVNNAFLNVHNGKVGKPSGIPGQAVVTQDQYETILLANLRQLWSSYDDIAEVWFDGGLPGGFAAKIWALHQELVPNAVAFQGPNVGSQPNLIRWCGTESGHVSNPFWSAQKIKVNSSSPKGHGQPDGNIFAPAEADTCFQGSSEDISGPYGGCWFYNHGMHPKSLAELVSVYHDTIGKNAFLLLDWTPMQNGTLRADHIERYQEFGDWVRSCYGAAIVQTTDFDAKGGAQLVVPASHEVDRIVLQEDQSNGQRILNFTVNVTLSGRSEIVNGKSIGNKHIAFLSKRYSSGATLTLNITQVVGTPKMTRFAAHNCSRTPIPTGCSFMQNFAYKHPQDITIKSITHSTPNNCCSACRLDTTCAVFVMDTSLTCFLLSANQGGEDKDGFISGAPN